MHFLLRTLIVLAIAWLALLLSGYGVLFASHQNAAGLLSLIHISEPTRLSLVSRMPSSA